MCDGGNNNKDGGGGGGGGDGGGGDDDDDEPHGWVVVDDDGSPCGEKTFLMWNPPVKDPPPPGKPGKKPEDAAPRGKAAVAKRLRGGDAADAEELSDLYAEGYAGQTDSLHRVRKRAFIQQTVRRCERAERFR